MSRFVSAGTVDDGSAADDDWERAKQQVEASRTRKQEQSGLQESGKSLYEVLQANKAAKQEAFDEAHSLKNQFRSLDEDEADFLDSVLESTRAKDAAVKKETAEQLAAFRRQQEAAEKSARDALDGQEDEADQWKSSGKKRKKARDKEIIKGVKLRKSSSTGSPQAAETENAPVAKAARLSASVDSEEPQGIKQAAKPTTAAVVSPPTVVEKPAADKPSGLALVAYDSDDD